MIHVYQIKEDCQIKLCLRYIYTRKIQVEVIIESTHVIPPPFGPSYILAKTQWWQNIKGEIQIKTLKYFLKFGLLIVLYLMAVN